MAKPIKKKGLGNPAVLAAASSPAGQQAVRTQAKLAEAGIQFIPWLIKLGVTAFIVWYLYGLFKGRFIKLGYNPNLQGSNVTDGQALSRANALYEAMVGLGADIEIVAEQLAGLNYNGWVKVYNAFGNRKGINPLGDAMNLVEWLHDQFSDADDMAQLQNVLSGVF